MDLLRDPSFGVPIIACVSLLVNIPLGYIREWTKGRESLKTRKFLRFCLIMFWIHASIPVILLLRKSAGLSGWWAFLFIFVAVVGQFAGGAIRKKRKPVRVDAATDGGGKNDP